MEIMTTKMCPEVQYKLWNAYNNFGIEKSGSNISASWNRSENVLYAQFTYGYEL